jgi:PAX-interacting protein 1
MSIKKISKASFLVSLVASASVAFAQANDQQPQTQQQREQAQQEIQQLQQQQQKQEQQKQQQPEQQKQQQQEQQKQQQQEQQKQQQQEQQQQQQQEQQKQQQQEQQKQQQQQQEQQQQEQQKQQQQQQQTRQIRCPSLSTIQQAASMLDRVEHFQYQDVKADIVYTSNTAFEQSQLPWHVAVVVQSAQSQQEAVKTAQDTLRNVSTMKAEFAIGYPSNKNISWCYYGENNQIIAIAGELPSPQAFVQH